MPSTRLAPSATRPTIRMGESLTRPVTRMITKIGSSERNALSTVITAAIGCSRALGRSDGFTCHTRKARNVVPELVRGLIGKPWNHVTSGRGGDGDRRQSELLRK